MIPLFGPGGNSDGFKKAGYRSSLDAPRFVTECGLDAYEYEAGQGIAGSPEMLAALGQNAALLGVKVSFHTPYFISLSSVDPEKRVKSVGLLSAPHQGQKDPLLPRQTVFGKALRGKIQEIPFVSFGDGIPVKEALYDPFVRAGRQLRRLQKSRLPLLLGCTPLRDGMRTGRL